MAPSVWWVQYRELLLLRWTLSKRNLGVTLSQVLIGAVACITLSLFQYLANTILSTSTPHYPSAPIGAIPRCAADATIQRPALDGSGAAQPGCYTLLYAPDIPEMAALVGNATRGSPGGPCRAILVRGARPLQPGSPAQLPSPAPPACHPERAPRGAHATARPAAWPVRGRGEGQWPPVLSPSL